MPSDRVATGFDSADESPGFLLWQVANVWQRRQRAALKPLGLTHVQFVLLAVLAWQTRLDGGIHQVELAREARTDPMMTSQVVRILAERSLVDRCTDSRDARASLVRVTAKGRALANQALPIVEAVDREFFGSASREAATLLRAVAQHNAD